MFIGLTVIEPETEGKVTRRIYLDKSDIHIFEEYNGKNYVLLKEIDSDGLHINYQIQNDMNNIENKLKAINELK